MIVVKVQGGIGNQLMQYSFGRALSVIHKKEVAYDLSFFDTETKYTSRPYLLNMFNTQVRRATEKEILDAKYPHGALSKISSFIGKFFNKYFFKKYYVGYNQELVPMLITKDNYYVEGFWQSYKYYEDCLSALSQEITLRDNSNLETFKKETQFDSKLSVAVHIRRGDFLKKNAGTTALETAFYEKAVPVLCDSVAKPDFFIFSDDIEWVKQEMGHLFGNATYVSTYKLSDCEEFALMKECQHAIIANSTFSWFSALLSNDKNKVVVYSNDWKNVYLNRDVNICPASWKGI